MVPGAFAGFHPSTARNRHDERGCPILCLVVRHAILAAMRLHLHVVVENQRRQLAFVQQTRSNWIV